jgi:hypothetical protein
MTNRNYVIALMISISSFLYGQTPIDIYESTEKIEKQNTQEYLCGLVEGDQLLFSFEVIKGGKLDQVEISEYPSSARFTDYKTSKIKQKVISISHTGIYRFRFTNEDTKDKICKYTIQRIPANDLTVRFNPTVYWNTAQDTTVYTETQPSIVTDTIISNLSDKVVNVHALFTTQRNKVSFGFKLPLQTIAYSYYIGVNQAGSKVFCDATTSLLRSAGSLAAQIPGYGPLAALALNGTSFLTTLTGGESVQYWITDIANSQLFMAGKPFKSIKQGNVVNDFSRVTTPLEGEYYICLENDNKLQSLNVTVKITAISLHTRKVIRSIKKYAIETRKIPYLKN